MSFKKEAIFTTGPLPLNRKTSPQFASYGAFGSPCDTAGLRITMINTDLSSTLLKFLSVLWAYTLSLMTKAIVTLGKTHKLPETSATYDLSPRPLLIVTMNPKSSEEKINKLTAAGFSARTSGRYKYYIGPARGRR